MRGLKRPTPVTSNGTAPATAAPASKLASVATESAANDGDPIATTLAYREALGGANNQCTDSEAQKKKFKIFRAAKHGALKSAAIVDLVGGTEEESKSTASTRPTTAASRATKSTGLKPPSSAASSRVGKVGVAKKTSTAGADESSVNVNESLAGVDDPIALAMQDRIKAGGLSTQIKELDAKK